MNAIGIYRRNEVGMIIRQYLKTFAPALFLLLCCSISAFAQSAPESQRSRQKDLTDVTFHTIPVKVAIDALGSQLNLNVIFDDAVKDSDTLTIMLKDVTIEQAIKIVLVAKRLQARIIEEKKIIVFPDHEANRQKYGQYELWPAKSDANK
jgi:type II secretory pathway component GspD/PulD (secretin)